MYIYKSFVMFFLYTHIHFVCTSTDGYSFCFQVNRRLLTCKQNEFEGTRQSSTKSILVHKKKKRELKPAHQLARSQTYFSFYEFIVEFIFFVQARINRFEVGTRTRSLAGIVAYNSDFSSIVGKICVYVYMIYSYVYEYMCVRVRL